METKVCNKCKMEKPLTEFSSDIRYKSGYKSWCRNCVKTQSYLSTKKRRMEDPEYDKACKERMHEYWKTYKHPPRGPDVCEILHAHSQELKDDPDHLPTEFLQKLIGVKCK